MCWGSPSSWSGRVWYQRGSWLWTWIWWWRKGSCSENLWAISCRLIITIQEAWHVVALAYRNTSSLAATAQILFFFTCQSASTISTSPASTILRSLKKNPIRLWSWCLRPQSTPSTSGLMRLIICLLEREEAHFPPHFLWGYPIIHQRMKMKMMEMV